MQALQRAWAAEREARGERVCLHAVRGRDAAFPAGSVPQG